MGLKIETEINKAILEVKIAEDKYTNNLSQMLGRIKDGFLRKIDRQFTESRNPYEEPWQKTKKKTGKTLIASTELRRSFEGEVTADTIKIGVNAGRAKVAGIHHFGSAPYIIKTPFGDANRKPMTHPGFPRRLLLPEVERGLPDAWKILIEKVLNE